MLTPANKFVSFHQALTITVATTAALCVITGCGSHNQAAQVHVESMMGTVHGGQQPVSASTIQLYAVGSTGDGSSATPLLTTTVTTSDGTNNSSDTNANAGNQFNALPVGSFTITGDYTCPSASTQVYLVATGGNPGMSFGTNNTDIALMAALGSCGNLSATTSISINEVTTVGSIAPLSRFLASPSAIGSGSSDSAQLTNAFGEVTNYVDISGGVAPGPTLPPGYNASTTALQTLADIIASCINSTGGAAGSSGACGQLLTLATPQGGTAPTDTITALANILNNPTLNASSIYSLLQPNGPFQPTLVSAPSNWSLPITSTNSAKLAFQTQPPSSVTAGSAFSSVTVAIEDTNGTVQTAATNPVTLSIGTNPSSGTLSGTLTVNAINGIATFSGLSIDKVGTGYTLAASGTGLTTALSSSFNVNPGAAAKLAFIQQPTNAPAGFAITPSVTVAVQDAEGNTVTSSSASVTMAIGSNPSSGTLSGTTSVPASSGIATFSNLLINNVGSNYTIVASSSGLTSVTSNQFNVTGPTINVGATTVGSNSFTTINVSLPTNSPGTGPLVVTSTDPTHFLLTTNVNAVGTTSLSIPLTTGSSSVPTIYLQGQNYSGTTAITSTVTASAPGYSQGSGIVSLYPSGLGFGTSSFSTTPFSSNTQLVVSMLMLNPGSLTSAAQESLGPQGLAPSYTITSGTTATGTITGGTGSYSVNGGTYSSTDSFVPAGDGTSTLTLTEPTGYYAPGGTNWPTSITATVTAPTISVPISQIVGNNFMTNFSVGLQNNPTSSETMTVTSSDPTHFLLSLNPGTVGTATVTYSICNSGCNAPTIYLQGQNYSGTTAINATLTASAPNYTTANGTLTLYPSGLAFATGSFNTTTFSSATNVNIGLLVLTPGSLTAAYQGSLGPQASPLPSYTITSGTTSAGTITGGTGAFTVNGSTYSNTDSFTPAGAGTSTLTLNQPSGYYTTTSSNWPSSITATVTAPNTTVSSSTIVGNNLITSISVGVQTAPPNSSSNPITMTVTSNDPTHFLLTTNPNAVGTSSVTFNLCSTCSTSFNVYLEGQNYSGTASINSNVSVSASGYNSSTGMLSLYPSGIGIYTGSFSTTTFSSPTSVVVGLDALNPSTLTVYAQGSLGPQANPLPSFTLTSVSPSIGTISGGTCSFTINGGTYCQGENFVPVSAGTDTIQLTQPTGYYTPANVASSITATVNAPNISMQGNTIVGDASIISYTISLQAAPPNSSSNPLVMTVTSNDPTHFLLTTNPGVVGTASLTINLCSSCTTLPSFYIEGQNYNNHGAAWTTTLTASADGYNPGSGTLSLYPSGIGIYTSSFSTHSTSGTTGLVIGLDTLDPTTLNVVQQANRGPQSNPTFTITSGTPSVGTIGGGPATWVVNGGTYNQNYYFQPVSAGSSTLSVTQPTGFFTPSNVPTSITATVNP